MSQMRTMGDAVGMHARLTPNVVGARDLARSLTFRQWNERSCRLANALLGLGLVKGDRVAILAYNCLEWMEIYVAVAKAGLVAVPINFRLVGPEILYIVNDAEAAALIVQDALRDRVEEIRSDLSIVPERYVQIGGAKTASGYHSYEALIDRASASEPSVQVLPDDTWVFMYTSGTTGKPKGALRTHEAGARLSSMIAVEQNVGRDDTALLVMPMFHANSLYFATAFAYRGASTCVYNRQAFDAEHLLATLSAEKITFTSLVPTHYIKMLGLPDSAKATYDVRRVSKLLVSSAPARKDTKLAIMEYFGNSRLYEMYGSTEAGWVTCLRPDEQFTKLGSIGREVAGTSRIKLLDPAGNDVPEGDVGELYSRTPYSFVGYWKLPEKTAEAFRGPYCSVGDLARRDGEGYYYLVDRKNNMIISGGENIYPSEVENMLGSHPKVKDVAVIGVPDDVWGESVRAVVVLHDGQGASEGELVDWCRTRIAGYKRPKSIAFVRDEEMPRTATGKILHRVLRERLSPTRR